jgi:DNA-binding IclR family transcriptional regulator
MSKHDYLRAFIARGKNRHQVLAVLAKGEKTQAEVHHETGLYRTHVRRTMVELEKQGLIRCLNPKDRIYKIYVITVVGKRVLRVFK